MDIDFDPAKDQINQSKHGLSLAAASDLDLSAALVIEDRRRDYGEERFIAYAPLSGRLHAVWYTVRGNAIRVIGLRKANRRERARYEARRQASGGLRG